MLVRSLVLSSQNFRSHPCSASDSMPPGPELPQIFSATGSTASSVILTGIKIGVSLYIFNKAQEGIVFLVCFPSKTDVAVSLIVPVRSAANSYGCKTPPFYLSQTNSMALRNLPFRTRFENVKLRSSGV